MYILFFSYVENTNHRIGWQDHKAANCKCNEKCDNVAYSMSISKYNLNRSVRNVEVTIASLKRIVLCSGVNYVILMHQNWQWLDLLSLVGHCRSGTIPHHHIQLLQRSSWNYSRLWCYGPGKHIACSQWLC